MNLETEVLGFKLENPIMPASGPLVGDFSKIMDISNRGVGAVVTKTISTKSAVVPRPCIYAERDFVMNAELWSELPPQEWIDNILPKLREELDKPLIVSVGYTEDDMEFLIPKLDPFADAFEVSTHYVGKDIERIGRIVRKIRSLTKKPIAMKMSPHIPDPVGFAKMVKENGGNAVVAINSVGPSMKIDVENRRILFGDKNGFVWLSGPYIKPIALAMVH
ncbi:MAG TPA: dihydroorotate dehydrogenase, partial [Thermotogales bacterium]|nr:dihydroorotate dehydrogenase [Thermotogales bacterium]